MASWFEGEWRSSAGEYTIFVSGGQITAPANRTDSAVYYPASYTYNGNPSDPNTTVQCNWANALASVGSLQTDNRIRYSGATSSQWIRVSPPPAVVAPTQRKVVVSGAGNAPTNGSYTRSRHARRPRFLYKGRRPSSHSPMVDLGHGQLDLRHGKLYAPRLCKLEPTRIRALQASAGHRGARVAQNDCVMSGSWLVLVLVLCVASRYS